MSTSTLNWPRLPMPTLCTLIWKRSSRQSWQPETTCAAIRGAPPLRYKVVNSQRTTKARRSHSLPLLTYSRAGGLRQPPGRAAELAAVPGTHEEMGHDVRVLLSADGGRGDEPLVG